MAFFTSKRAIEFLAGAILWVHNHFDGNTVGVGQHFKSSVDAFKVHVMGDGLAQILFPLDQNSYRGLEIFIGIDVGALELDLICLQRIQINGNRLGEESYYDNLPSAFHQS